MQASGKQFLTADSVLPLTATTSPSSMSKARLYAPIFAISPFTEHQARTASCRAIWN